MIDEGNLVILLKVSDSITEFWFSRELDQIVKDQIKSDFRELFESDLSQYNTSGLIYNSYLDSYFYIKFMGETGSEYIICSSHKITSALPFYYNRKLLDSMLEDKFAINLLTEKNNYENFLSEWSNVFEKYVYEFVPNVNNEIYNDELLDFMLKYFENHLPKFFYALILEIPTIISGFIGEFEVKKFKDYLDILLPFIKIGTNPNNDATANLYVVSSISEEIKTIEYVHFDVISKQLNYRFRVDDGEILLPVVEEIIEYHKERIVPIENSITTQVFWNIQKIYGVLALNEGKIDFKNYLDQEDFPIIFLLNQLYEKMTLFPDNHKENS